MSTPINFADYNLKAKENILTAEPKKGIFIFIFNLIKFNI